MTSNTRRSFTNEFKQDSVALLESSGRPQIKIKGAPIRSERARMIHRGWRA